VCLTCRSPVSRGPGRYIQVAGRACPDHIGWVGLRRAGQVEESPIMGNRVVDMQDVVGFVTSPVMGFNLLRDTPPVKIASDATLFLPWWKTGLYRDSFRCSWAPRCTSLSGCSGREVISSLSQYGVGATMGGESYFCGRSKQHAASCRVAVGRCWGGMAVPAEHRLCGLSSSAQLP
jgi:hypothetical protein